MITWVNVRAGFYAERGLVETISQLLHLDHGVDIDDVIAVAKIVVLVNPDVDELGSFVKDVKDVKDARVIVATQIGRPALIAEYIRRGAKRVVVIRPRGLAAAVVEIAQAIKELT